MSLAGTESACALVLRAISLDLDGELSEFGSHRLRRHLAACEECRARREQMRFLVTLVREQPDVHAEHVMPAVPPRVRRVPFGQWGGAGLRVATTTAVAICIAVGVGGATLPVPHEATDQAKTRLAFADVQHLRAERGVLGL